MFWAGFGCTPSKKKRHKVSSSPNKNLQKQVRRRSESLIDVSDFNDPFRKLGPRDGSATANQFNQRDTRDRLFLNPHRPSSSSPNFSLQSHRRPNNQPLSFTVPTKPRSKASSGLHPHDSACDLGNIRQWDTFDSSSQIVSSYLPKTEHYRNHIRPPQDNTTRVHTVLCHPQVIQEKLDGLANNEPERAHLDNCIEENLGVPHVHDIDDSAAFPSPKQKRGRISSAHMDSLGDHDFLQPHVVAAFEAFCKRRDTLGVPAMEAKTSKTRRPLTAFEGQTKHLPMTSTQSVPKISLQGEVNASMSIQEPQRNAEAISPASKKHQFGSKISLALLANIPRHPGQELHRRPSTAPQAGPSRPNGPRLNPERLPNLIPIKITPPPARWFVEQKNDNCYEAIQLNMSKSALYKKKSRCDQHKPTFEIIAPTQRTNDDGMHARTTSDTSIHTLWSTTAASHTSTTSTSFVSELHVPDVKIHSRREDSWKTPSTAPSGRRVVVPKIEIPSPDNLTLPHSPALSLKSRHTSVATSAYIFDETSIRHSPAYGNPMLHMTTTPIALGDRSARSSTKTIKTMNTTLSYGDRLDEAYFTLQREVGLLHLLPESADECVAMAISISDDARQKSNKGQIEEVCQTKSEEKSTKRGLRETSTSSLSIASFHTDQLSNFSSGSLNEEESTELGREGRETIFTNDWNIDILKWHNGLLEKNLRNARSTPDLANNRRALKVAAQSNLSTEQNYSL